MESEVSSRVDFIFPKTSWSNQMYIMEIVEGARVWSRFTRADEYRPDLTEVSDKLDALRQNTMIVYVRNPDIGQILIEIAPTYQSWTHVDWQYRKFPVVVHRDQYEELAGQFTDGDYWLLLDNCHVDNNWSGDLDVFIDEAHRYLQEMVDSARADEGLPRGYAALTSHGTHALQVQEMGQNPQVVGRSENLGLTLEQLSRRKSGSRGVHVSLIEKPEAYGSIPDQTLVCNQFFTAVLSKMYLGTFLSHGVESSDTDVATVELRRNEFSSVTSRIEDLILQVQGMGQGTATITTTVENPSGLIKTSFEVTVLPTGAE